MFLGKKDEKQKANGQPVRAQALCKCIITSHLTLSKFFFPVEETLIATESQHKLELFLALCWKVDAIFHFSVVGQVCVAVS